MNRIVTLTICALAVIASPLRADPRLPRVFTDHMVIQQQKPINIWGWADKGEAITVSFSGQQAATTAGDDGTWMVTLKAAKATAAPQSMTVKGKTTVALKDVLIGEVWFFGRQSAIDISLGKRAPKSASDAPLVRFFSIERCARPEPQTDLPPKGDLSGGRILFYPADIELKERSVNAHGPWRIANNTENVDMSAAAFVYARDLSKRLKVPVGIIDVPMGSSVLESWMSPSAVTAAGADEYSYLTGPEKVKAWDPAEEQAKYATAMVKFEAGLKDQYRQGNGTNKSQPLQPVHPGYLLLSTSGCYNATIWPLRNLGMRGVLLYQGACYPHAPYVDILNQSTHLDFIKACNAYYTSYNYQKFVRYDRQGQSIPHFIPDWRKTFGDDQLAFALIEPIGSGNEDNDKDIHLAWLNGYLPWYREAVAKTCKETPGAGLIAAHDLRKPGSRQPSDESVLAERCLNWALGTVYKKEKSKTGPLFDSIKDEGKQIRVTFKAGSARELKTSDGKTVHGFWTGKKTETDKGKETSLFLPATARISGDTIIVSKAEMNDATDVRYDWTTLADGNLVDGTGLPLLPFRTDSFGRKGLGPVKEKELDKPMNEWTEPSQLFYGKQGSIDTLGATGLRGYSLGVNIVIKAIEPGSPADGIVMLDDALVGANGTMFGKDPRKVLGRAIDESQNPEYKGTLTLKLVRNGDVKEVELTLETLPAYSDTSPYDCPRASKILSDGREYIFAQMGAENATAMRGAWVGLNLLSSGEPRYQNLVRRTAHAIIAKTDKLKPHGTQAPWHWHPAYEALFLSEYYLATGDKGTLPALQRYHDFLLLYGPGHRGVWSHGPNQGKDRGDYGALNGLGSVIMTSLVLMGEGGIKVDQPAFNKARAYFDKYTQYGRIIYGTGLPQSLKEMGFKPADLGKGIQPTGNGSSASSAVLWKLMEPKGTKWRECAEAVADSYQSREYGHGGHFYSFVWGPVGASLAGKQKLAKFMREQRWYYALLRRFDHGLHDQSKDSSGSYTKYGTEYPTAGLSLGYAIPEKGLRITGKEASLFARTFEGDLATAVEFYQNREYETCVLFMKEKKIAHAELSTQVERMIKSIVLTRAAIEKDLKAGDLFMAQSRLTGLKPVVKEGTPWLTTFEKVLSDPVNKDVLNAGKIFYDNRKKIQDGPTAMFVEKVRVSEGSRGSMGGLARNPKAGAYRKLAADYLAANPSIMEKDDATWTELLAPMHHLWFLTYAEQKRYLPKDWLAETYNRKGWYTTTLANVWPINHWAVLRTSFRLKGPKDYKRLKLIMRFEFCENTAVYLNGTKIVQCEAGVSEMQSLILSDQALKLLRKGENHIAVIALNMGRWNGITNHPFNVHLEGADQ
jgi:sialate O-acetylesterase